MGLRSFPIAALVCMTVSIAACSRHPAPSVAPTPPAAVTVTTQKWFSVAKERPWHGGCRIRITPEAGPNTHLRSGEEVAWLLVNDCDNAADLRLEFFRNGKPVASPITFEAVANGVLKGRVNPIVVTPEQPWVRFKYTVIVGDHRKDPEIVIFP